ncbi:uncharacterized protein PHALS_09314 [Plasmopara halstedii]|uniref:Uncharacterized protein n=1 Tax=Plasmopara halstedii TaxID=4781 RepID=A0A0P1AF85_PLAHL|nr:uncharacterized protein PHALS_09314 [Plasmopara halstedii]CEG39262.1 hypothetical protein PHALS_09314 [Plasmopara halstedii]|eukprot:XP_024575631.1 hypothetical protein PHALS_09314 [Plasmopara halstedii]
MTWLGAFETNKLRFESAKITLVTRSDTSQAPPALRMVSARVTLYEVLNKCVVSMNEYFSLPMRDNK